MVQLPRIAALKSKYNNSYLRYLNDNSSPLFTFLQYSSEEVLTPFTNFEFHPSKSDPSLYHIRSCYNNRYWCSLPSDRRYIVAGAIDKDEDQTQWTCTLFRPAYDTEHQSFRFLHVHRGFNVVLWRVNTIYSRVLRAQWSTPDRDLCDLSTVIDWECLISLPKFIAFKRDDVGFYLTGRLINRFQFLVFASDNLEDPTIQMETSVTNDGRIVIKSNYFGGFWTRGASDWMLVDSNVTPQDDLDSLFLGTKLDSTIVALRNLGNGNFVKRFTSGSRISFLNAETKEIDEFSHLRISELVRSREISDAIFHIPDARIRDQAVVVVATGTTTNNRNVPISIDFSLSYTDITSSTWASSISTKLSDVNTTLDSDVLRIVDGKDQIQISDTRFSGPYKWGETITTSNTGTVTYQITIPPMSTVTVKVLANRATCDVPFSYQQRDILLSGNTVEFSLDDGVYCGTNYYNFSYELDTKPI